MNTSPLLFEKVNWRTYLDPTNNPRVERFLKKRGDVVLKKIVEHIKKANEDGKESVYVMVHPNVSRITEVKSEEYTEVLEFCIKFFEETENYELCQKILDIKNEIGNVKKVNKFW